MIKSSNYLFFLIIVNTISCAQNIYTNNNSDNNFLIINILAVGYFITRTIEHKK